jgi:hypothetical protein
MSSSEPLRGGATDAFLGAAVGAFFGGGRGTDEEAADADAFFGGGGGTVGVHIIPQKLTGPPFLAGADEAAAGIFLAGADEAAAGTFFPILEVTTPGMMGLSGVSDLRRNGYGF